MGELSSHNNLLRRLWSTAKGHRLILENFLSWADQYPQFLLPSDYLPHPPSAFSMSIQMLVIPIEILVLQNR